MLDPQVQIRIIDLAEEWAKVAMPRDTGSEEAWFNKKTENFDLAYKAILKTVEPERTGTTEVHSLK